MVYLVIIVVIAAAGIGRLWLVQRRHSTSLSSVEGFRSSLERLAGQQAVSTADGSSTASHSSELGAEAEAGATVRASQQVAAGRTPGDLTTSRPRAASEGLDLSSRWPHEDRGVSRGASTGSSYSPSGSQGRTASDPYVEPLDPERRAAAKRRLEARRRGASRSGLRSR